MLDLLELGLGSGTDLDDGNAAGELCEALLELLAVELGIGVLHLALDGGHAVGDGVLGAGAVNDGGVVLGDSHALGSTEHIGGDIGDLDAELIESGLATGEDGDVLEHALAAVTVTRSLHGADVESTTDLVQDERRQSLAVDVLGDDEQALASAGDGLEHGHDVLDIGNLLVGDEDVGSFITASMRSLSVTKYAET